MKDKHGNAVKVGDRIVCLRGEISGRVVTIRQISKFNPRDKGDSVKADDSRSGDIRNGDFTLATWLFKPSEFALVDGK